MRVLKQNLDIANPYSPPQVGEATRNVEQPERKRHYQHVPFLYGLGTLVILVTIPIAIMSIIALVGWCFDHVFGAFGLVLAIGMCVSSLGWLLGGRALVKGIPNGWLWLFSPVAVFVVLMAYGFVFGIPVEQ